jgi:hypothetical protein
LNKKSKINKASEILIRALKEGLNLLSDREEEIERIRKMFYLSSSDYYKFGTIGKFDSGVVRYNSHGGKFKYQSVIDLKDDLSKVPSWVDYHELIKEDEFFKEYYDLSEFGNIPEESKDFTLSLFTKIAIQRLLDSYIYLNERNLTINDTLIDKIVTEHLSRIFADSISFNIWVPIIFTDFECDYFEFSDKVSIRRITNDFQIARNAYVDDFRNSQVNKLLIQGCSHAIVLKGFKSNNQVSNSLHQDFLNAIETKEFKNTLKNLTGAINIISKEQLFYHQVFSHSESGLMGRYAEIESVNTTYIDEEIPEYLSDYGWLRTPKSISTIELENSKLIFKSVNSNKNSKIEFATRKLISASLRNKNEDALLDATIGLESILSNDSKSEITYRLSMRGGFVCKLHQLDEFTPSQIRDFLKKIYAYRSAIVHGAKELDKLKKSKIEIDGSSIHCNYLALKILRHALKFFIDNPEFLDLKKLENKILNE